MRKPPRRGRPKTSQLSRTEQLRAAKRAQRARQRHAGVAAVELRLQGDDAERLRAAAAGPHFREALENFLRDQVVEIRRWPVLRELAWNRADRYIPAEDAFALYERNWRHVDPTRMAGDEAQLVERLKRRYGAGLLNV